MNYPFLRVLTIAVVAIAGSGNAAFAADSARDAYSRALGQERFLRTEANHATLAQIRRLVASYERIVRRHPSSGYSDNALWQAANMSRLAFDRFGNQSDRRKAADLLRRLNSQYPASSLLEEARGALADLEAAPAPTPAPAPRVPPPAAKRPASKPAPAAGQPPRVLEETPPPDAPPAVRERVDLDEQETKDVKPESRPAGVILLKALHRSPMPDGVRITIELDDEVAYRQEELAHPRRVFFDLKGVRAAPALQDVTLRYDDDVVREIRLGRHPQNTLRLVLDLEGADAYSVYPLYGPHRLVIDVKRTATAKVTGALPPALVASLPVTPPATESNPRPAAVPAVAETPLPAAPVAKPPLPSKPAAPPALPPAANGNGKFSLSRQLGLGVSRVVIDAGHGGYDPGAQGNGIAEAELTLDVALRLQKLLEKQPGIEVVMTRDTDVFIPLQERTAIANREGADLFLSIHANASRNSQARGIETYFLNFALNPEAEAVAARENATSAQSMHSLPDIVKTIALNNKINESRDFAGAVQQSMVKKLRARNKQLRDLGVKQAPFVVLIGAGMPSVLAEISFVTHRQEGSLLKTNAYRQQIAQALFDAVVSYQGGLKKMSTVAGGRSATK